MKIFIDTNIFLDLILKRKYYKEAMLIFNAIEQKIFMGYMADITILNIDYIAKKQIKDIREFLNVVNKTFTISGATNSMIKKALEIKNDDLEDNIQYLIAKGQNCKMIITNDKKFINEDVEVISSEEFCNEYL